MSSVDLTKTEDAQAEDVYTTTVALFNNAVSSPRVLAECENYLAYTLKNGHTLRLIFRSNNIKGSLREHTKPIRAVRFVNYRSNVAASAADGEFLVWVVSNDNPPKADPNEASLTVKCYFKLTDQVTIPRFAFFINPAAMGPDLLILHESKASVLESSKLIAAYESETLTATLAANSRELRALNVPASSQSLCATNTSGWFAFTTEETLVVACTLRNTSTPAWHACDKAPVKSLELLMYPDPTSPSTLLAGSDAKVFQWRLEGDAEPVLVRTFLFGDRIEAMLASHHTFAIFNSQSKVALVECAQPNDQYKAITYQMPFEVTAGSLCFYRTTHFGCALVDRGDAIEMVQLTVRKPPTKAREERKKPSAAEAKSEAPTSDKPKQPTPPAVTSTANAMPFVDPAILTASPASPSPPPAGADNKGGAAEALSNLMNQVRAANKQQQQSQSQQVAVPVPATASAAAQPLATSAPAPAPTPAVVAPNHQAARAAIQNSALLQTRDGPLMEAAEKGDENIERRLASIRSVLTTINDILRLTPGQASRDHEELLNLALEAQMTQLQQNTRSGATPSSASASSPAATLQHDQAFNSYALACLMAPIAREISTGVTTGITRTLQTELDNAIKNAFGDSVRDSQKQILKQRLDEALEQSSKYYADVVRQRLLEFTNNELRAAFAEVNASMSKVISDNRRLQQQLNQIVNSGILNEVAKMKTELRELRVSAQSGALASGAAAGGAAGTGANPSAFQGARPTPETMLSTAKSSIENGAVAAGLDYMVMAQIPELTVKLFEQLPDEVYSRATADKSVSDDTWIKTLTLMTTSGAAQGNDANVKVADTLFDVLSERDDLIDRSSADVKLLRSNIRHFVSRAKDRVGSNDGQETLRSLEKLIQ